MSVNVKILGILFLGIFLIGLASATVTYNQKMEPTLIVKYDASTGTSTRASPTTTLDFDYDSYDLFDDDATTGDYIVWIWDVGVWQNLTINITTPLVSEPFNLSFNSTIKAGFPSSPASLMDWAEPPNYTSTMIGGTVTMTNGTYDGQSATVNSGGTSSWSGSDYSYFGISSAIAETGASFNFTAPEFGLIYEYRNATGWFQIPNVTDETNNFTNSGVLSVDFPVPEYWDVVSGTIFTGLDYKSSGVMMRARIVYAGNISEGGHVDDYTRVNDNMITLEDEDYVPSELYADDLSNGWGCMQNINSYYSFMCNLQLITSNLTIRDYQMMEVGNASNHRTIIQLDTSSIFQIGNKDANGPQEGSYFKYWNHNGIQRNPNGGYNNWLSTVRVYNSGFMKYWGGFNDPAINRQVDLENSQLETMVSSNWYLTSTSSGNITNVAFKTGTGALYLYSDEMTVNNLIFAYMPRIVGGVKGVILENINFATDKQFQIANSNAYVYAVNSIFSDFEAQTNPTSTNTTGYIQYDLDLTVLNKSGIDIGEFNVTLVNALGTTVYDGNYTDVIRTTVYEESNVPTSITHYNPIEMTISKVGYANIYSKFNLTADNRKMTLTMGAYPFEINGTIVISQEKGLKIFNN